MNRLSEEKRALVIRCLLDGNSMRGTARIAQVSRQTVTKLLIDLGPLLADFHDRHMQHLEIQRLELDELWSFIGKKDRNLAPEARGFNNGEGSVWTWLALDPTTKLVPVFMLGDRDTESAIRFAEEIAWRVTSNVEICSDAHEPYVEAIWQAFEGRSHYAQVKKIYGTTPDDRRHRYLKSERRTVYGKPIKDISTSLVERVNLNCRMNMRRYTRKTSGFSRKKHNHWCALQLHFFAYNFVNIHRSIRMTPAMKAGICSDLLDIEDLVQMLKEWENMTAETNPEFSGSSVTMGRL